MGNSFWRCPFLIFRPWRCHCIQHRKMIKEQFSSSGASGYWPTRTSILPMNCIPLIWVRSRRIGRIKRLGQSPNTGGFKEINVLKESLEFLKNEATCPHSYSSMNQYVLTNDDKFFYPYFFAFCGQQRPQIKNIVECSHFLSLRRPISALLILGDFWLTEIDETGDRKFYAEPSGVLPEKIYHIWKQTRTTGKMCLVFAKRMNASRSSVLRRRKKIKQPLLAHWPGINLHFSDLPEYKGLFPVFWELKHKEKRIGISVHLIDQKIDEGEVIT